MEKYASKLGKNEDSISFSQIAGQVKMGFLKKFYNVQTKEFYKNTSTASVLGLAFNLVLEEARKKIFTNLVAITMTEFDGHKGTGLVGAEYLMRILTDNGRADLANKLASNKTYPSWVYG